MPARSCSSIITTRESRPAQPRFIASVISASARLQMRIGRPSSRPSAVASADVLVRELEREVRRIVLAGQPLVDQRIEGVAAPGRALAHRLPQRERLDAGLHAHREGLGQRADDRVARHVVHELRHRGAADRPDVAAWSPIASSTALCASNAAFVAADPDRELARSPRPAARRSPARRACARPFRRRRR